MYSYVQKRLLYSENYIFGKFDAFCKRLEKIDDMLNTMENLAGLNSIKIEVSFIFGSWAIWLSFRYYCLLMANAWCCWTVLWSLCFVFFQGMETMIVRYNSIVTSVKKKGYDLLDHRKGEVRVIFFQLPFYPVMLHVTYCAFKIFLLVWHWLWRIQTEHWWTETAAADVCWFLVWETIVCKYLLFTALILVDAA